MTTNANGVQFAVNTKSRPEVEVMNAVRAQKGMTTEVKPVLSGAQRSIWTQSLQHLGTVRVTAVIQIATTYPSRVETVGEEVKTTQEMYRRPIRVAPN